MPVLELQTQRDVDTAVSLVLVGLVWLVRLELLLAHLLVAKVFL